MAAPCTSGRTRSRAFRRLAYAICARRGPADEAAGAQFTSRTSKRSGLLDDDIFAALRLVPGRSAVMVCAHWPDHRRTVRRQRMVSRSNDSAGRHRHGADGRGARNRVIAAGITPAICSAVSIDVDVAIDVDVVDVGVAVDVST